MNGKHWELDGHQIEELREALMNAFTEDQLKQMLRFALNERWDNIKKGETYEDRVFNLIDEWAESKGKIKEIVIAALYERIENQSLQEFTKNYFRELIDFDADIVSEESLIELIDIFKRIDNYTLLWNTSETILPQNLRVDCPCESQDIAQPKTPKCFKCFTLLKLLLEKYPQLDQCSSILTFVKHLSQEFKLDNSIKQKLQEWLYSVSPDFNNKSSELETTSASALSESASGALQAYLMITVNPEKSKAKVRAIASLLCIPPNGDRKAIPVQMDSESKERGVLCTRKKLPQTVAQFIETSIPLLDTQTNLLKCAYQELNIELFLPIEYLCEPVDCREMKDDFGKIVSLGSQARVVLRSYDRIAKPRLKNAFSKSWHYAKEVLKQNLDATLLQQQIQHLEKIDCNQLSRLEEDLQQKIVLKVTCALPESEKDIVKFLQSMLSSGIPIAFWTRCRREFPVCGAVTGIDQLLKLELLRDSRELLEKVKKERKSASTSCEILEECWGRNLSVLWDDWERMPSLTLLNEGGQQSA